LNTDEYKDVKDEWKLVTLFIGANNVCVLCEPPITRLPGLADADIFEKNVRRALERIQTEVGKSFVNLVALFNVRQAPKITYILVPDINAINKVSSVYEASRGDPYCEFVLDPSHMVICSCIQGDERQRKGNRDTKKKNNVNLFI
jgi:hypothetical protein